MIKLPAFKEKSQLFEYLVANKTALIDLKKSSTKTFCINPVELASPKNEVVKSLATYNVDDISNGVIKRSIIGNTYYWLDSHDDVHVGNTFKKSISETSNKVFHFHDHKHELVAQVGKFQSIYEKQVEWSDLNIPKTGKTIILVGDTEIKRIMNPVIFEAYLKGEIDQHSVGMQYVKMTMAINDPQYKEEFAEYERYISLIGNEEKAEKQGYFFAHSEAKLKEISCVCEGSNPVTHTFENIEPAPSTQKQEPAPSTPQDNSYLLSI